MGMMMMMLRALNLTDQQKAKVHGIFDEHRASFKSLVEQMHAAREQLAEKLLSSGPVSEADLVAFAAERLAGYKAPRRIRIVDVLPRTGTEKVQKRELIPLFD